MRTTLAIDDDVLERRREIAAKLHRPLKKVNQMKRISIMVLLSLIIAGATIAQAGDEITVSSMPPVVVKTFPQAGDTAVDPFIKEIRVTFSKDMMTKNMWSWVMISRKHFPTISGKIRYLKDRRTCVAPVKLEPGKTYAIWINSSRYKGFRDTNNNPAVPFLLVFQTRK